MIETLRAGHDGSQSAIVVWDMRVTRTLVAAIVGMALGVAGALMQAMTRNSAGAGLGRVEKRGSRRGAS